MNKDKSLSECDDKQNILSKKFKNLMKLLCSETNPLGGSAPIYCINENTPSKKKNAPVS